MPTTKRMQSQRRDLLREVSQGEGLNFQDMSMDAIDLMNNRNSRRANFNTHEPDLPPPSQRAKSELKYAGNALARAQQDFAESRGLYNSNDLFSKEKVLNQSIVNRNNGIADSSLGASPKIGLDR